MPRSFLVKKVLELDASVDDGAEMRKGVTTTTSDDVMDASFDSGCEESDIGDEIGKRLKRYFVHVFVLNTAIQLHSTVVNHTCRLVSLFIKKSAIFYRRVLSYERAIIQNDF